jgi:hypothetical protein
MPRRSRCSSCRMIRSTTLRAPGTQCIVLDESITARLHNSKPDSFRLRLSGCSEGDDCDKGLRPGEAESAASRRRLVRTPEGDVQVHLPQACHLW